MERDKRQEDPGMGARAPSVESGPLVAQHCTAYCVYCVPRYPSLLTLLRKVYVRYVRDDELRVGPSSKEPSPGLLTTLGGGGEEGTGYPGEDRSQYTWKGLRAREEYARLMWEQTNHLGPFAALPARYVPFSSMAGRSGLDMVMACRYLEKYCGTLTHYPQHTPLALFSRES